MSIISDRYLGDGVYASFDGFCVILDLRGQDNTTRVAMEPEVREAFALFVRDLDLAIERHLAAARRSGGGA